MGLSTHTPRPAGDFLHSIFDQIVAYILAGAAAGATTGAAIGAAVGHVAPPLIPITAAVGGAIGGAWGASRRQQRRQRQEENMRQIDSLKSAVQSLAIADFNKQTHHDQRSTLIKSVEHAVVVALLDSPGSKDGKALTVLSPVSKEGDAVAYPDLQLPDGLPEEVKTKLRGMVETTVDIVRPTSTGDQEAGQVTDMIQRKKVFELVVDPDQNLVYTVQGTISIKYAQLQSEDGPMPMIGCACKMELLSSQATPLQLRTAGKLQQNALMGGS